MITKGIKRKTVYTKPILFSSWPSIGGWLWEGVGSTYGEDVQKIFRSLVDPVEGGVAIDQHGLDKAA